MKTITELKRGIEEKNFLKVLKWSILGVLFGLMLIFIGVLFK